ncbi:hypothetical protein ACXZ1K_09470 [Pedobacter sp. PWIIR3]
MPGKIKISVKLLLLTGMLLVGNLYIAIAQSKTYLTGQKTGNFFGGGAAISLGTGSASVSVPPLSSHSTTNFAGLGTTFRFYYGDNTVLTGVSTTPVKLTAAQDLGVVGLLGAGADVYIQFRNTGNSIISSGTTTYFKLKEKPTLSGASVAVGGLLGLVEIQNIIGRGYSSSGNYTLNTANTTAGAAYNGTENVGTVAGSSANTITRTLIDKDGEWYLSVTPDAAYNSVRLNVALPSDLRVADVARKLEVNVYHAFTQSPGNACSTLPQFTNAGEASGITINSGALVGGLDLSQLVANPQYAINGVANQYSSFSSGLASVGVASKVSQSFFYDHVATTNDGVHLHLGIEKSLIGLSLAQLNGIKFYAYSGISETPVYTQPLGSLISLLGLDVLNLINIGSTHKDLDLSIKPGVAFDRFKIEFDKGLLGIGVLGDALRIYDVSLAPSAPTITVQPSTLAASNVCEGASANFSVTATVPSGASITGYQWQYYDGTNWISMGTNSPTLNVTATTIAMNNRLFRVKITGGVAGCLQDITSNPVPLTVQPLPTITLGSNPIVCRGIGSTNLSYTAVTGTSLTYSITWVSPLLTGVNNQSLPASPITINIPTGIPAASYSGSLIIKNASGCESSPALFSLVVQPKPLTPHVAVE